MSGMGGIGAVGGLGGGTPGRNVTGRRGTGGNEPPVDGGGLNPGSPADRFIHGRRGTGGSGMDPDGNSWQPGSLGYQLFHGIESFLHNLFHHTTAGPALLSTAPRRSGGGSNLA